jgi:anti-sigma factor RsiW
MQAHLDNELSTAERVVFEHHMSECTMCARRLAEYKKASALLFEAFAEDRLREPLRHKVLAHLPELEHQPEQHPSWQPQYKPVRFQWLRTLAPALAPILVLLLGITLFYAWPPTMLNRGVVLGTVTQLAGPVARRHPADGEQNRIALHSAVYAGERFETQDEAGLVLLLDGPTTLKADANTRLQVQDNRKILLESGRIWLDVAEDPRLFRVETPSGGVTVFGTTFDVLLQDDSTVPEAKMTVTVSKGAVHVESGVGFTQLHHGQE